MTFTKYLKEKENIPGDIGFKNDKNESKYNTNFSEGVRTNNAQWQDFINKGIKMWDEFSRSLWINVLWNKSLLWAPVRQRHGANRGFTLKFCLV